MYKKLDKTLCSNYGGISFLSTTYKSVSNIFLSSLTLCVCVILVIIIANFNATKQLHIRYSSFVRYLKENVNTVRLYMTCLCPTYSDRREELCDTSIFSLGAVYPENDYVNYNMIKLSLW